MIINLAPVLSPKHLEIHEDLQSDLDKVVMHGSEYKLASIEPIELHVRHVVDKDIHIACKTKMTILIPCDRCLDDTEHIFDIDFFDKVTVDSKEEAHDEIKNYLDGYELDVDRLLFNELLIGWPMKVLCKETCEGICSQRDEADLDPRMSAIRDIYQQFKEV